jgi:GT2 family glycosyltransferase
MPYRRRTWRRTSISQSPEIDIAIVVVHWNVPTLLDACLRSIADVTVRSYLRTSVLVVDSASDSPELQAVLARHPGARTFFLTENHGYAAGCNAGIRATDSEAVLLLNPDTELQPGALDALWSRLQIRPHIGLVAPLLVNPDGSLQSWGYRFPGVRNILLDFFPLHPRLVESTFNGRMPHGDGELPIAIDYPLGAAMLVRRSAVEQAGLLDETYGMYCEEIDLAQRLARAGYTRLLAPTARVIHHGGQSTGQRPAAMHEALWFSRARYYRLWTTRRTRLMAYLSVELGTRWDDRRAGPERRAANARIRRVFRRTATRP